MKTYSPGERAQKSILVINVGLAANALLAALKTTIGILGHSPALLADGINSTSDVAYGIVVKIFMHLSAKPADDEHPYGHERLESIATVVVGAFVMCTAITIFWTSINEAYELWQGENSIHASKITLYAAFFSIVLKIWLSVWTKRFGKQLNNSVLLALATDHRNDIFSSLAATVGIIGSRMNLPWIDPLAGAVVAGIILFTGIEIIMDAAADLMNTNPGKELKEEITKKLVTLEKVVEVEEINGHRFGAYMVLNITIGVSPTLTIAEGNRIATEIEKKLINEIDSIRRVFVHYHPTRDNFKKQTQNRTHIKDTFY